jgi:homospermidine synthase
MSHFTSLKTNLVDEQFLLKALHSLGYVPKKGRLFARGFAGSQTRVDICVPTKNPNHDIGFRKTGDAYELVADWWGIHEIEKETFIERLTQHYAYHATRATLEEQGFAVAAEEVECDGAIHLVLNRMS